MNDDAYIILKGQTLTNATTVLFNDELPGPAAVSAFDPFASHGTAAFNANGTLSYTPTGNFTGIDLFDYTIGEEDGEPQTATVYVHVVPVNVGATTTLGLTALTAEEQIASTYVAFFGRAADSPGFHFWVNEFNKGLPTQGPAVLFANIASSFGISAEAKALYPFLSNPFGASDQQIGSFLDSIYHNLFNRGADDAGKAFWTGQIKNTLAAGEFVGSVLVNIMSGAQNNAAGQDITTLMGKVAVSLRYVEYQDSEATIWTAEDDGAESVKLLSEVTSAPDTVLTGVGNALALVIADDLDPNFP